MRKILKARKGGFTLVELLIVITIIGVLASMMMMSTGAATDTAEAARLVADATLTATAAVMFFADHREWPLDTMTGVGLSLDLYMNKDMFSGANAPYTLDTLSADFLEGAATVRKNFIGIVSKTNIPDRVQDKLSANAGKTGIFQADGTQYKTGNTILVGVSKTLVTP